MTKEEFLILVDAEDTPRGRMGKWLVHRLGMLHRAFSVFIFNTRGEMLLQQRAESKYHSAGLWSNACCSHPRWGEATAEAVERRLEEELRMRCRTEFAFTYLYQEKLDNGLTEHELDHIFIGITDREPSPDPSEVKSWKYISPEALQEDVSRHPEKYTCWFRGLYRKVVSHQYHNAAG